MLSLMEKMSRQVGKRMIRIVFSYCSARINIFSLPKLSSIHTTFFTKIIYDSVKMLPN
jgi:hypothetical protein